MPVLKKKVITATAKPAAKKTAPARKASTAAPATKSASRGTARKAAAKPAERPEVVVDQELPSTRGGYKAAGLARRKVAGVTFKELAEITGFGIGTDNFVVTVELLKGGDTKLDIVHRVATVLPPSTRFGTPKQVSNLVSGVIRKLESLGFTSQGSWIMVPPQS